MAKFATREEFKGVQKSTKLFFTEFRQKMKNSGNPPKPRCVFPEFLECFLYDRNGYGFSTTAHADPGQIVRWKTRLPRLNLSYRPKRKEPTYKVGAKLLEVDRVRLSVVQLDINVTAVKGAARVTRLDLNRSEANLLSVAHHDVLKDRWSKDQNTRTREVGNLLVSALDLGVDDDRCVSIDHASERSLGHLNLLVTDLSASDGASRLDVGVIGHPLGDVEG